MLVHQATGTLQPPGSLTRRQRHLCELMVVCKLSRELGSKEPHDALLNRLVHNVAEIAPAVFSKIVTREPDGSFVCRADYHGHPLVETHPKNQNIPAAAWPFFTRACSDHSLLVLRRQDPALSDEERRALGLTTAERVWLLPIRDGLENVGVLILGESRNGTSSLLGTPRMEMITGIVEQAAVAIQRARRNTNLEDSFIKIILALAEAIDSTDPDSYNHGYRTANLAVSIARRFDFSGEEIENIRLAGVLHDIGKVEISEDILRKPGPLSPSEWEVIRRHPVTGAELLAPVTSLSRVAAIIRSHHEKYDGRGYPYGLRGEEIPLEARILAVADAYSVMINGRVYRQALTQAQAMAELRRCAGTDFDPGVVDELLDLIERGKAG